VKSLKDALRSPEEKLKPGSHSHKFRTFAPQ